MNNKNSIFSEYTTGQVLSAEQHEYEQDTWCSLTTE
jgi:hypothetical protein